MYKRYAISILFFICGCNNLLQANDQTPEAGWDRSSAMAAVQSVDIEAVVSEVGDISSLSDGTATLIKLKAIENRSDWPLPAREAALYQFARTLASLPRDAVATEVMLHLRNYRARVLVPHEEHPSASVPLFNIRAAAAGIENGWQRAEWAINATSIIESMPAAAVETFLQSDNHNRRSGFVDALRQADARDVETIQSIALEQLESSPQLTAVIAATLPITADNHAIRQLLVNGRGAELSSVLQQLDRQLQTSETAELLSFAIAQAPASNAALAIAAWWPRLSHDSSSRDLMLDLLADPALGANAVLALAGEPDLQTIKALQDIASGDSAASKRAQMALDLNRENLIIGGQP
ncbi:MAG: hypothetical protein GQ538_01115 [Xanthomonadales bacterium]|nr:hypothetical protein [Xanthomonadales bacterium]